MFPVEVKKQQIESIHEKTLWVLEHVGVNFEEESAAELFRQHGAKVEGATVYITEAILRQALDSTPGPFTVQGLSSSVTVGGGAPVYVGSSNAVFMLREGKLNPATKADYIDILKLCETSDVLSVINSQHIFAFDIPTPVYPQVSTALALQYSSKPVLTNCSNYEQSVASLAVSKEFYESPTGYYAIGVGNMVSPLRYTGESIGAIKAYAEYNQPMVLACCSGLGMTSPVTVGGTIVQNNAEVLAGIVYGRLLRPGLPMVYGNVSGGLDMRYMSSAYGAFEAVAMIPYTKALADYYGLPARSGGALTDSKQVDYQAGTESAMTLAATMLSGIDFAMHMAGEFESYNAFSLEKQVLDEETIHRVAFLQNLDLFAFDDETKEVIAEAGPGGQYVMADQTLDNFKDTQYIPELSHKEPYATWEAAGCMPLQEKAAREVDRRLAAYEPPALSQSQQRLVQDICKNI